MTCVFVCVRVLNVIPEFKLSIRDRKHFKYNKVKRGERDGDEDLFFKALVYISTTIEQLNTDHSNSYTRKLCNHLWGSTFAQAVTKNHRVKVGICWNRGEDNAVVCCCLVRKCLLSKIKFKSSADHVLTRCASGPASQ